MNEGITRRSGRHGVRPVLLFLSLLAACGHSDPSQPAGGEAPSVSLPSTQPEVDATSSSRAPPRETWLPPLPAIELATLTETQQARVRKCMEDHPIDPDTGPTDLVATAQCMGEIPAPGREIQIYKNILTMFPDAPEFAIALRRTGRRLEQIDQHAPAIDSYVAYVRRYPKEEDARALGQRAVCLALALGADDRAEAIMGDLDRLYGRQGFSRPSSDELTKLCAQGPPEG